MKKTRKRNGSTVTGYHISAARRFDLDHQCRHFAGQSVAADAVNRSPNPRTALLQRRTRRLSPRLRVRDGHRARAVLPEIPLGRCTRSASRRSTSPGFPAGRPVRSADLVGQIADDLGRAPRRPTANADPAWHGQPPRHPSIRRRKSSGRVRCLMSLALVRTSFGLRHSGRTAVSSVRRRRGQSYRASATSRSARDLCGSRTVGRFGRSFPLAAITTTARRLVSATNRGTPGIEFAIDGYCFLWFIFDLR